MTEPKKADLKALFDLIDEHPLCKPTKGLVAEEDENGVVHVKDPKTGGTHMMMTREDWDAIRAYKPETPP